jgi:hypothetical protein
MIVFSGGGGRPPDYMAIVNIRSMMAHVLLSQARNAPKSTVAYASKLFCPDKPEKKLTGRIRQSGR